MTPDLCFLPAIELLHHLRKKELSARDVLSAHLAQIERVNPKVNATMSSWLDYVKECLRKKQGHQFESS